MTGAEQGLDQQTPQTDRQLIAGRYRLLSRIGSGQLGVIYEANDEGQHDLGVERHVAIQLLPDSVAENRRLFDKLKLGYAELRSAPHPNIVPILDFAHDGRFGYLATEFLEGVSLRQVLDTDSPLPIEDVMPVVRAVGSALQFLHAKSIVHGRLSAESVFITVGYEVWLFDVVPLDATVNVLRSVAAQDSFSRRDEADDIYGLACLTYEMLTGKHPFNYHTLAEARLAGLEPARIESLPEKQWNALRHALAFGRKRQTVTIAAFLQEFGIKGTERLRPPEETTVVPRGPATPISPAAPSAPVARAEDALDAARARGKRPSRILLPVLVLILVGLGAWFFYGQPGEDLVRQLDVVDAVREIEPPASAPIEMIPEIDPPVPAIRTSRFADLAADEPADTRDTDGAFQAESGFTLVQSVTYVSERDGAARIATRHPGNEAGQIYWWTADDTAVADGDYIPVQQSVLRSASGDYAETLHIPLVNDSVPEPQESFFVYLGRHDAQSGRLELVASVRVEIGDDD